LPVIRLVLCISVVVVLSGVFTLPAPAAGLYTHTWFVERTIQRLIAEGSYTELVNILNAYPAIVNYGSIYPDITITIDDNWAEVLHDTYGVKDVNYPQYLEFLDDKGYDKYNNDLQTAYYKEFLDDPEYNASIPQFRAALLGQLSANFRNRPRSEDDKKMIAFLFGLIAHQEADGPWHLNYNVCNDPNYLGIGWGLECEAKINKGYTNDSTREVQLDWILYHYDSPEHTVDFPFMSSVKSVILTASDVTGSPRPVCNWTCPFWNTDPIENGESRLELLWGQATSDWGANDGMKGFLETYVPGGIDYGSALAAAAWMQAWFEGNKETIYLPLLGRVVH
jgi:Zinc dependent phospholipase C